MYVDILNSIIIWIEYYIASQIYLMLKQLVDAPVLFLARGRTLLWLTLVETSSSGKIFHYRAYLNFLIRNKPYFLVKYVSKIKSEASNSNKILCSPLRVYIWIKFFSKNFCYGKDRIRFLWHIPCDVKVGSLRIRTFSSAQWREILPELLA